MTSNTAYEALTAALDVVIPTLAEGFAAERRGVFARHLERQNDIDPTLAVTVPGALVISDGAFPDRNGPRTTVAQTLTEKARARGWGRYITLRGTVMNDLSDAVVMKQSDYSCAAYVVLSEEKLAVAALRWATDEAHRWREKMAKKLGNVDSVRLSFLDTDGEIVLVAQRDGHEIRIAQQRIIKTAPKRGNLFCQWPARIRVDGKATTERDYNEMFGEGE